MPEKGVLPVDIPAYPNRTYDKSGWSGMGDWLGTGRIADQYKEYRSFQEARAFVHSLNLKSAPEWRRFCQGGIPEKGVLPVDIPATPNQTYKEKGWKGYGDWLGTGRIADQYKEYRSFQEARAFVQSLNLKSETEWRRFCKGEMPEKGVLPADIPAAPNRTYGKSGWSGMGDWLGNGRKPRKDSPK